MKIRWRGFHSKVRKCLLCRYRIAEDGVSVQTIVLWAVG